MTLPVPCGDPSNHPTHYWEGELGLPGRRLCPGVQDRRPCRCRHEFHRGQRCLRPAAEFGHPATSPDLCYGCLFSCEGRP